MTRNKTEQTKGEWNGEWSIVLRKMFFHFAAFVFLALFVCLFVFFVWFFAFCKIILISQRRNKIKDINNQESCSIAAQRVMPVEYSRTVKTRHVHEREKP